MKISEYIKDLESAFRLDCSDEDIKTDKEAKQTYKVLQKLKKRVIDFNSFLCKQGINTKV